jgi:hypothetical protein
MQRNERRTWHAQVDRPATAINDRTRRDHLASAVLNQRNDFFGAAAGGDHVFYDDRVLSGLDLEASPKRHLASIRVPFREEGTHGKRARYFVADDDASNGRRNAQINGFPVPSQSPQLFSEPPPQTFGVFRDGENLCTLEVLTTVEATRQTKMTPQIRPCFGK